MAEPLNLKSIERRPRKYWNADGLPELVMGLLWIVWGGAWLAGQALPRGGVWNTFWLITPVLLAMSGLAATWAIKQLKARITFPRAGYVELQQPTRGQRTLTGGVGVVVAAALAAGLIVMRRRGLEGMATPALGVALSLGFVVASLTQRAPHLLALAGVALLLGLAFGVFNAGWESMNWMLVALGAVTMIAGALRLRAFLLRNPLERPA